MVSTQVLHPKLLRARRWFKWLKWFVALVVNCFHILKELDKINVHVVKQSTLYLKVSFSFSCLYLVSDIAVGLQPFKDSSNTFMSDA
ncbi:RNA-directed RNA polymerase L [Gossypium arboreum]|uniref:RNA-directed RNA polymerase L n=1 Tax=Gossypium arboreum TaxID=29729 RepID=A0A0B0Q054_GOSAR|nr:RNA-directed RNA polymerase L [Gossypium arboreum]KHG29126.1 RNA-directed RNA polymerase L [Gossypium arboreum]KHG29673.1 RNA-directed RNA polymerase L [Gossypium arboreum]